MIQYAKWIFAKNIYKILRFMNRKIHNCFLNNYSFYKLTKLCLYMIGRKLKMKLISDTNLKLNKKKKLQLAVIFCISR